MVVVFTNEQQQHDNTMSDSDSGSDMDCEASQSGSAAGGTAKRRRKSSRVDKESDEYRQRRERNNLAVKKSRSKSKMKTQETLERVNKLRAENEMLEAKIKLLAKELSFLKDLFLAHAGSAHGQTALQDVDLSMFGEPTEAGMAATGVSVKLE